MTTKKFWVDDGQRWIPARLVYGKLANISFDQWGRWKAFSSGIDNHDPSDLAFLSSLSVRVELSKARKLFYRQRMGRGSQSKRDYMVSVAAHLNEHFNL
jgi:hypothetical protein